MGACSTDELLCLHLAAVGQSGESGALSTAGLLDALGVGENAIAGHFDVISALSALTDRGLVETRRAIVEGDGDPETVYELTAAGREYAGEVETRLARQDVVVESDAGRETLSLGDAADRLGLSLAEAAGRLRDDRLVLDDAAEEIDPDGTPFVGRGSELSWLEERLDRARSGRQGLVRVEGEPGVGKTALATEFGDRVERRGGTALYGQCARETETPYGPVLTAIGELPPAERDRIVPLLTATADDAGADEPEELEAQRRSLFAGVADELATPTRERPIVLILDDAQWIDRPTALLVAHLANELDGESFLAIALSYPTSAEEHGALGRAIREYDLQTDTLTLAPFDPAETTELVGQLVGARHVPGSFVDAVHDHTGGNPLFVTESVTRMIEEGVVRPAAGVYPETADDLLLPGTVQDAIVDRLEGADDRTRRLLEVASLIGTVVPEPVLSEASAMAETELYSRVELLVGSRLWTREDGESVRFVSDVVRETVRETVPDDRRTALHRRIARAHETREVQPEAGAAAAFHYDRAGAVEKAIDASLGAAERATEVYAHEVAIETCERAVELARETDDETAVTEALELLGDTYETIGEYEEAIRCFEYVREHTVRTDRLRRAVRKVGSIERRRENYERAREQLHLSLELAEADADWTGVAESHHELGGIALDQSEFDRAREHYRSGLDVAREQGDRAEEADCLDSLGLVARRDEDYETAREYHRRSLAIARELGDRSSEAASLHNLGSVALKQGDLAAAREHIRESLEINRELGQPPEERSALDNLGLVAWRKGELDRARECFEESLATSQRLGQRQDAALCRNHLGAVALKAGDPGTAREHLEAALEGFRDVGDRHREGFCLHNLGEAARKEGQFADAREFLREALAVKRDVGDEHSEAVSVRGLGLVDLAAGNTESAREQFEEALAVFQDVDDRHWGGRTLGDLGRVELRQCSPGAAREHLAEAIDVLEEVGDAHSLCRYRGVLGAAELACGEQAGRETREDALAELSDLDAAPEELVVLCYHVETELELGNVERARKLYGRARSRLDRTDGALGVWRDRLDELGERLSGP